MTKRIHRRLILPTVGLLLASGAWAQPYWSAAVGGPGNDHVRDVKTDAAGNIYATGEFSGAVRFGGNTYVSTAGTDMFLAKLSPAGQVLWFVQGGGPGGDGGIKLAVRGGRVAVVGTFMQTATFQGQSLTSAGAQDIFIAMHDAATGALLWIAGGGGPLGSDRPYGVSIASTGNVTMAGEFSGTAQIGGSVFTSMNDPQTGGPSVDVFVATYSPAGTPLWALQGAAKFADRAIDVVHDPADNIYVTGQFSDTIQFAVPHPNVMYNATFLLKLDPAGNELWFRRMGGALYNQVRDMQWASTGELLMVGDLQGTMIFLDSVPDLISSGDPYAYYLLRVDGNGQLAGDTVVSSLNPVSGRAVDERNGLVTVLGEFKCQFTSLADSAHAGLWTATGIQDLFIVRHSLDSLYVIKYAQQFGGRQEKLAGQVASLNNGEPVFCGSFEDMIVFPCQGSFTADIASTFAPYGLMAPNLGGYCDDPYYGSFAADTSNGLKDGFIARGCVAGRAPYDWWDRSGTTCSFLPGGLCLGGGMVPYTCADTVEFCGPDLIGIKPGFSFSIDHHDFFVGPELDFLWSTGDTTDSLKVHATGDYAVTCTAINGCLQWTDSIHVIIHPFPPQPLLSDDVPVATDSPYSYQISLCDPEDGWLWCSNVDTTTNFFWSGSSGVVAADSILVDTSGSYFFNMINAFGCVSQNSVVVTDYPNVPIPEVAVSLQIIYPQDVDLNDTLELCPNVRALLHVVPTWTLNGMPYVFNYTHPPEFYFGYVINGDTSYLDHPDLLGDFMPNGDGWYVDTISVFIINSPCGQDTLSLPTVVIDSIYVHVFPSANLGVAITGPAVICPSDTAVLVAHCTNCDALAWQGNGILSVEGDSAFTGSGQFMATASAVDTNGCTFSVSAIHQVSYPGVPELDVLPPEGIICPDSIAVVYTNALGSYSWFGPQGEIAVNNDSIPVTIPGEYYLSLVDPNGCYLVSDPILITGYATPFIQALPDAVLCMGEGPATLQVITTGYSSFAWAPPLTGQGLTVQVSQPGTYSCTVQACGIVTQLSVDVVAGSATAEVLNPGPFVLCPGDTVALVSASSPGVPFWNPGQVFGDTLLVYQPGSYTLAVMDGNGCADTSAAVVVAAHDFGGPLTLEGVAVCSGTPVTLVETAPGSYTWYADSALATVLGTGPVLDLGTPGDSLTVYVVRSDSVCTGLPVPVGVAVLAPPAANLPDGPLSSCAGDTLLLIPGTGAPYTVMWATPGGSVLGDTLVLGPLALPDSGWYVATATAQGCTGPADSVYVMVWQPDDLSIGADTTFCPGGSLTFTVPPGFTDPVWQQSIQAASYTVSQTATVHLAALDLNGCLVQDTVQVTVPAPQSPAGATDVEVCLGHDAVLTATGSGTLAWYADPGLQVPLGMGATLTITAPAGTLVVYLVQEEFGCAGPPMAVTVNVIQTPVDVQLAVTAPLCIGQPAEVQANGPAGMDAAWTTPAGARTGVVVQLPEVGASDGGWYVMVPFMGGCIGPADSIFLSPLAPEPFALGPDSTICRGGALTITLPPDFTDPVWSTGEEGPSIVVYQAGTYTAVATGVNGCPSTALLVVTEEDCQPVVPNVITPNGDGVNDAFTLGAVGAVHALVDIYNRWGQVVHQGDVLAQPWKGLHDRTGDPVPDGVYYYVLRLEDHDGRYKELTGYLMVRH
ncbi:MAG TPA: gliding motility-associated C-terminal domain-containing protein [Flavobacteriales bacterium]|nr:gliding motility-associated C-terminal domain-containing protein [Flavobacteriales bacterium]